MGGIVTKQKKDDDSDMISIPNDDIYADDARDAVELALNKKAAQTMIELTISCQNLPKLDFLSQTDAKVVCYVEEGGNFFRHDSTEVIPDCPNPFFEKKIVVPYNFEKPQTLKFEIYDVDEFKEQDLLDKQELIGHITTTLHQIVCSPNQTISKEIIGNQTRKNRARKCGLLNLTGKEIDESNNRITFHISFTPYLSKSEFRMNIAPSDNVESGGLKIHDLRLNDKKGLEWTLTITSLKTLTYDNSKMKLRVLEKVKQNKKALFGEAEGYLSDVLNSNGIHKIKVQRNGYDVGEIKIKEVRKPTRYTFLNYVDAGAEISLIIAMDFTKSNKEPTNPKSLHYILNDQDNEYLQALKSIGGILQYYDSDNKIPLYGFGAKLPPYFNAVSNCFSLNGNYFDPEVYGLEEVIKVYKEALVKYKFHGPTIFSELLKMASEYTKSENLHGDTQKYFILLILTDGDINDFEKTKDELVEASKLPMSIIIIGVGDDEFVQMNALDGDDEVVVSSTGEPCARDIVQFVPFSKYKHDPLQLAKKTLEEIPKQFLEYMRAHNIEPTRNGKKNRFLGKSDMFTSERVNTGKSEGKPTFLEQEREKFRQELQKLEMEPKIIARILQQGIPAPNINLVIEMISHQKHAMLNSSHLQKVYPSIEVDMFKEQLVVTSTIKTLKKNPKIKVKRYNPSYDKGYELEKLRPKETTFRITHDILNNRGAESERDKEEEEEIEEEEEENNYEFSSPKKNTVPMYGHNSFSAPHKRDVDKFHLDDPKEHLTQLTTNTAHFTIEENICLHCHRRLIDTVLMPCGHAAFCSTCLKAQLKKNCKICKHKIGYFTITQNWT